MFKCVNLCFIFLIISLNAYSQKVDCSGRPFYLSGKSVIYTDSTIVNGKSIYTDSLIVDISVVYTDSVVMDGVVIYTDSIVNSHVKNYHIILKNNPPFQSAIYRDNCEFKNLMMLSLSMLWKQQINDIPDEKKAYFIFSSDKKYVNYAYIKDTERELYAKYNPMKEDNNESISFSLNHDKNFMKWVEKEMNKGRIVSMGCKNKRKYICKSFNKDL